MPFRHRREVEPEGLALDPRPDFGQPHASGVGGRLHRPVVLGPDLALEDIDFARREPQQLRVLIRNDLERQPIQIGQLVTPGVAAPVMRVAREDDALAWVVAFEDERTEPGHLLRIGRWAPGGLERPVGERPLQNVPRIDRQGVKHPDAGRERRGEREDDAMGGDRLDLYRLVRHSQAVSERAVQAGIGGRLDGEQHVGRIERHTIRPLHAFAQLHRHRPSIVRRRPRRREPGLDL